LCGRKNMRLGGFYGAEVLYWALMVMTPYSPVRWSEEHTAAVFSSDKNSLLP
jgi:hypothetical protein